MTLAWDALNELDAYRITEIPRRSEPDATRSSRDEPDDGGRTQRLAAFIAAYHAGAEARGNGSGAVAIGWVRHAAGGPVQVLAAGRGPGWQRHGQDVFLTLPGGARAQPLLRGSLARLMAQLPSLARHRRDKRRAAARRRARHGRPAVPVAGRVLAGGVAGTVRLAAYCRTAERGRDRGDSGRSGCSASSCPRVIRTDFPNGPWRSRTCVTPRCARAPRRACGGSGRSRRHRRRGRFTGGRAGVRLGRSGPACPMPSPPPSGAPRGLGEALDEQNPAPAGGDAVAAHPFYASSETGRRADPAAGARDAGDAAGAAARLRRGPGAAGGPCGDHRRRDPGPGTGRPACPLALPLELAEDRRRVRLRRDRRGEVADGTLPARVGH